MSSVSNAALQGSFKVRFVMVNIFGTTLASLTDTGVVSVYTILYKSSVPLDK